MAEICSVGFSGMCGVPEMVLCFYHVPLPPFLSCIFEAVLRYISIWLDHFLLCIGIIFLLICVWILSYHTKVDIGFVATLVSATGRNKTSKSGVSGRHGICWSATQLRVCNVSLFLFRRSMSNWKLSKALSLEMIQLKEKVARFSSSSPFQNLEIIATLGVGGFGRVELVRGLRFKHLREAFWIFLFYVLADLGGICEL